MRLLRVVQQFAKSLLQHLRFREIGLENTGVPEYAVCVEFVLADLWVGLLRARRFFELVGSRIIPGSEAPRYHAFRSEICIAVGRNTAQSAA